jgi:3',5'-cyclic AMP phosphodiesterase CpdA
LTVALLLRSARDFDGGGAAPERTCQTCGEWLVRYVPYCTVCRTPAASPALEIDQDAVREKTAGAIRIGHLSDLHLGRPMTKRSPLDLFRIWLGALAESEVDVVVVSGDLVQRATDRRSLVSAREALGSSGLPWVVVPGNHDVARPGEPGVFEEVFGAYPRVEVHAGITFILIDTNAGLPPGARGRHERIFARFGCFVEGRVGEAQLEALDRLLDAAPEGPRVLVHHHHLVSQPEWTRKIGFMFPLQDADAVRRWAVSRGVVLALHGHHHQMRRAGVQEGGLVVLNGGSSTLVGPPYRARLVDLQPGGNRRVIPVELRL